MSIYSQGKELEATRGCVICEWERNGYNDSDFYARIWSNELQTFTTIEWGTTRFASIGYGDNCVVDATPEVRAAYDLIVAVEKEFYQQVLAMEERHEPKVGKMVRSLTTKGKCFGKSGKVFWRGANKFRTYYRNGYNRPEQPDNQVVGFKTADGESCFVELLKCEVIGI